MAINLPNVIFLFALVAVYATGANCSSAGVNNDDRAVLEVAGVLREVSPDYLSVTLASHVVQYGLIEELASSTRFITLSRGLSPAIVRVGGHTANFLTYDPSSSNVYPSSSNVDPSSSSGDPSSSSGDRDAPNVFFPKWRSEFKGYEPEFEATAYDNYTMTAEDFESLKNFGKSAQMRILFDLNQFYRTPEGTWDPTNAMTVVQDADETILWHLGNEPNSYYYNYKYNFTGTMDAADYLLLTQEMKTYYENAIIVGPDVTNPRFPLLASGDDDESNGLHMKFLDEFLAHLEVELSAITWHQYYLPGTNVSVANYTSLETLDKLAWQIPQALQLRDKYCPNTPIWLTETSSSTGGGAEGLSNAYVAGFLWLDKLGLAAVMGMDLLARQTLYGKRYALIDPNYVPYPDYWLSLLFKQLVGERVLEIIIAESPLTTRLYGHCQKSNSTSYEPGNVVIYGINVDYSTPVTVTFVGMPEEHSIDQYLLQPPDGDLQSKQVMLNDQLLEMTSDEELPDLVPLQLPEKEFQVPPVSFGFWVVKKANVLDCM